MKQKTLILFMLAAALSFTISLLAQGNPGGIQLHQSGPTWDTANQQWIVYRDSTAGDEVSADTTDAIGLQPMYGYYLYRFQIVDADADLTTHLEEDLAMILYQVETSWDEVNWTTVAIDSVDTVGVPCQHWLFAIPASETDTVYHKYWREIVTIKDYSTAGSPCWDSVMVSGYLRGHVF